MNYSKELYEYMFKIHEIEKNRIKNIEEKAKFIFSIISLLFVGVIFSFKDFLDVLKLLNAQVKLSIFVMLAISLLSLCISYFLTVCILMTKRMKGVYPDNLVDALFNPDTKFISSNNPDGFYTAIAKHIAISIEHNRRPINSKNKLVKLSWLFISLGFVGISTLIIIIIRNG